MTRQKRPINEEEAVIDIREVIAEGTDTVPIESLVSQGHRQVRVIREDRINRLITRAVTNIIRGFDDKFSDKERKSLEKDAKEEFLQLLDCYREMANVKNGLESSRRQLEKQVEELRREVELRRSSSWRVDEEGEKQSIVFRGWDALEEKIQQAVVSAVDSRVSEVGDKGRKDYIDGIDDLREYLRVVTSETFETLRRKQAEKTEAEEGRSVRIMEQRIAKLTEALKASEEAIQKLSSSPAYADRGMRIMLRRFGISPDEPEYGARIEMLKDIYKHNLKLQSK